MGLAASSTPRDDIVNENEMEAFDVVRIADDVIQRLRFGSQEIFKSDDTVIDDMLKFYEALRQDLIATQEEVARLKRLLHERDYAERKKRNSDSHKLRKAFKREEAEQLKLEQKLKNTVKDVKTKFMQYSCHQLCMDKEMESSVAFCKNNIDMVYGTLNNLVRASKDTVTELERQVSQVLYDLKHSQDLQYYVKEDLTFVSAKEIDVGHRAVIIVFVPFPQYKQYRRILVRLIHEVEKKFGGKHVVFVAKRRILPKPTRGKRKITQKQKRPRSRTLAAVHDEYLNDIVFPAEIVGKRIRVRLDGSRLLKVHLDRNQKAAVEHKTETFAAVYKHLTGKEQGVNRVLSAGEWRKSKAVGCRTCDYIRLKKELLECAKKENVIVSLGTGTGKTFIAVMLIREMSESVRQPLNEGGKRSLFIVDRVPLVKQQAEHIRINTNLKVGEFHGALGVDCWSAEIWMSFFDKFHVLVMTAEILRNILAHGFIKFDILNLIVFDECHHATKQHPYRKIMELYKLCYNNNNNGVQPRILGLTASVMNKKGDENGLQKAIRSLETTLCSRVVGTSHTDVLKLHSADPHIAIIACKNDNKHDWYELDLFFQHLVRDTQKSLERCGRECEGDVTLYMQHVSDVLSKLDGIMGQLGPWCALQICKRMLNNTTNLASRMLSMFIADDGLFSPLTSESEDKGGAVWLEVLKTCLKVTSVKLKRHIGLVDSVQKLKSVVSDRLSALLSILDAENGSSFINNLLTSSNKPFGIVFVNQRLVAFCIAMLIDTAKKLQPRSYSYIEVDYIVGCKMSAEFVEPSYARQEEVLKNFRNGNLNLLVATSILEEGIDVRQCNYVIRFDMPLTFRSFVQSKGRARQKVAYYTILVQDRFLKSFQEMLNSFVETEKSLKSYSGNNGEIDNCRKEVNSPNGNVDLLIEPYYTQLKQKGTVKKAACLVLSSAFNVIKRYCNKLRKDRFTDCRPKFSVQTILNADLSISYVATVQLPTNSPLKKKIEGKPMLSSKLAEMAAAFEATKLLHAMGELNEFLMPLATVRKEIELKEDEQFFSVSSKSYYLKEVPDAIYKAIPRADQKSYLYAISISSVESFLPRLGILISKPIGNLPRFSIFTDESDIDVEIEFVEEISYSADQLDILTSFHCCLFKNYLFNEERDFIFDPENAACSYLIVPLKCEYNSKCSVDLSIAEKITNWNKDVSHVPQQRSEKFIMNSSSYFNAVIYPWYKNKDDRDIYYFVTGVDNTSTPMSPFPFKFYRSFAEYFELTKQVKVLDKNQPLLKVKMVSFKRLNLLCEKQISILLFDFDDDGSSCQCKVVPELVVIHPMPASMWRSLIFLPTVLYRINHLLIAEQLRLQILREAMFPGEELLPLDENCEIQPLNKDWYLVASRLNDICVVDNQLPMKAPVGTLPQMNGNSAAVADSVDPETRALLEEFDVRFHIASPTTVAAFDDQFDIFTGNSVANSDTTESSDECLFDTHFSMQLMSKRQQLENGNNINSILDFGVVESDGEGDFVAVPALPKSELNLFVQPSETAALVQQWRGPQCRDVLRALTLRNAQDMFDLESMEALGDSFLKFIVSLQVFKKQAGLNEGRLSSLRSEIISNTNLFNLGKKKLLQAKLTAVPFDPTTQWLPPCFRSSAALESGYESVDELIEQGSKKQALKAKTPAPVVVECCKICSLNRTHQVIYDKSIADCVEALVGCYLLEAGMRPAIKLLKWFGIDIDDNVILMNFPSSSSSSFCSESCVLIGPEEKIHSIWTAYDLSSFEAKIGYRFTNKAYLIQALTHSSYNEVETPVTESYERLEFLGDAILDYLISRHLYSSKRIRSPGLLSDLRSALVNNVFFASMAVLNHFQKYFLFFNAELLTVNERFVLAMRGLKETVNFHNELYTMEEEEEEEKEIGEFAEHVEVPKPLGDIFESVAGAIFLDSHCSLATVWQVYYNMLAEEIDKCLCHPPKSPVRNLMELEPERVQFNILDREEGSKTVSVEVVVFGKGSFIGSGKSYRTAKHAAAKKALRELHPSSNHFII
ncbi:Endoribonuclease Dicer [Trichinella zimbabwensis]|uniref:Small ribosomal subunit protein eS7 n=1 Tax=Trichinella zimbabwensis TaxID=268475 RepID=A0A0V1HWV1_9BILA|nr:Endoribonuclease Dicer [Trichinella zimbabwensis]